MGETVEITIPVSRAAAERLLRDREDIPRIGSLLSLAAEGRVGPAAFLASAAEDDAPAEERARRFGEQLARIHAAVAAHGEMSEAEIEEELAARKRERAEARRAAAAAGGGAEGPGDPRRP